MKDEQCSLKPVVFSECSGLVLTHFLSGMIKTHTGIPMIPPWNDRRTEGFEHCSDVHSHIIDVRREPPGFSIEG